MSQKIKRILLFLMVTVMGISIFAITALGASVSVSQVKNLRATAGYSDVKLSWNKVSSSGYIVYYYNASTKDYKRIAKITSNSYTVSGLKQGNTYRYSVQAFKKTGGKTYFGKKSDIVKITTKVTSPSKVESLKATSTSDSIKLTWKKQSGVKYTVYSYNASSKKYSPVANVTSNSYTVKKLKGSATYSYSVRAYKSANGKKYYGPYSDVVRIKTKAPLVLTQANKLYDEALDVYMNWIYSCDYLSDTVFIRRKLNKRTCRFALVEHPEVRNMDTLIALLDKYFDESVYKKELYFYIEDGGKLYYYAEGGVGETDEGVKYYTESLKRVSDTKYTYILKPVYYKDYTGSKRKSYNHTLVKRDGKWIFTDKFYPCQGKIK